MNCNNVLSLQARYKFIYNEGASLQLRYKSIYNEGVSLQFRYRLIDDEAPFNHFHPLWCDHIGSLIYL